MNKKSFFLPVQVLILVTACSKTNQTTTTSTEKQAGYQTLFDGSDLNQWVGNKTDYYMEGRDLVVDPKRGGSGNLYTKNEYGDFVFRFEFQLTPGANNGLGIRTPTEGDAAYVGTEIQILDDDAEKYKDLKEYQ